MRCWYCGSGNMLPKPDGSGSNEYLKCSTCGATQNTGCCVSNQTVQQREFYHRIAADYDKRAEAADIEAKEYLISSLNQAFDINTRRNFENLANQAADRAKQYRREASSNRNLEI